MALEQLDVLFVLPCDGGSQFVDLSPEVFHSVVRLVQLVVDPDDVLISRFDLEISTLLVAVDKVDLSPDLVYLVDVLCVHLGYQVLKLLLDVSNLAYFLEPHLNVLHYSILVL